MKYTSENTAVLETHDDNGNLRMLLRHVDNERCEYIIGSNFARHDYNDADGGYQEFTWDWGHYFSDVVSAVDYWKREVLPHYDQDTCPHCGTEGELELESADDADGGDNRVYWHRCQHCGGLSKQVWSLTENAPVEG